MKKAASASSRKGLSMKGLTNSMKWNGRRAGGRWDLMVRLAIIRRLRNMNATARIVHPKPILGIKCWTMIGSTTPPMLDPESMMPNARARCLRNQVPQAAITKANVRQDSLVWARDGLTRVEEKAASKSTAYTLCKKKLVVFCRNRSHH
jgi:hypothetical protein